MSFKKVDYIPNQPFSHASEGELNHDLKKQQTQKWKVLFGVFLLVVVIINIWNWTRPEIFESRAILQFSYPAQTELDYPQVVTRKVDIHKEKLMSNSVLQSTLQEAQLLTNSSIDLKNSTDFLTATTMERLITLSAKYKDPTILQPVLDSWIAVYLKLVESEQVENNSEVMNTSNTQLLAIENKIDVKRKEIISFAEEHEITSLERDENRLLIKVKALSANLDQAISEKTAAQALLNSLVDSVQKNQSIIRDEDKAGINATKQRLQLLTRELSSLEQKYTQAYLERDPIIVNKQQTVTVLEKSLFEQLKSSQKLYLQDTERDLTAANEKVLQMQLQFEVQNQQAQIFSQKLQEYKILNTELTALQEQEQKIRNQQVSQEVSQPFDAKISVLEAPYTPNFPSGPDYWFISLISLLVAFVSSVIALLLFGYVVKQKYVPQASTNYMVVPGQSLDNGLSQLSGADQVQLAQNSPTLSIGSETSPNEILRELTEVESKALYSVSNSESKVIIGLVYAGLNIDELCQLERSHFSEGYSTVSIQTGSKRILELSQHLSENIALFCQDNSELTSFWSTIDKVEDLEQVVINTAYDVELENPEQFSLNVLRHTYICYLVRSGVRLNDLNKIVGKVSPSDLAKYRPFQRVGSSIDFETINLHYPLHKQVK